MVKFSTVAALVLVLQLVYPARAQEGKLDPLIISYPAANAVHWNLDVALDEGFFRDEGFAGEPITFQSAPQSIQLLISGAAHVATVQPEALIAVASRGASDLGAIAQPMWRPEWAIVVRPEIKSWADLKGKTLGFSALRIAEFWLTQKLLAEHGVAKGQWDAIQVGPSPAKLAALEKGSIAGAVLFEPSAQEAVKLGLVRLSTFASLGNYTPTLLLANRSWAAQDQRGLRFTRALTRAHHWLFDPANETQAIAILQKYTRASPDIVAQVYRSFFVTDKIYKPDPAIDLAGLLRVAALMAEVGEIPADKLPAAEQLVLPKESGGWMQ
jgi:ABC-type nitrate/sulfonate/bicarbonate transport system substrate-binding protein